MEKDKFYYCLCTQAVFVTMAANILETRDDPYRRKNIFEMDEISKAVEYILSYPASTLEIGLHEEAMYVAEAYLGLPDKTSDFLIREFWDEYFNGCGFIQDNWSTFDRQIPDSDKQRIQQAVEQALLAKDSDHSLVKLS